VFVQAEGNYSGMPVTYVPKVLDENVNVSKKSPVLELLQLLASILLVSALLYWWTGLVVDLGTPYIPRAWEKALTGLSDAFFKESASAPDASQKRVNRILKDLLAKAPKPLPYSFDVRALAEKEVNAVALPGGKIAVFQGLLDKVNDEELAFVLGHELGHLYHRDHLRGMGRGLILLLGVSLMGDAGALAQVTNGALQLQQLQFSREQEIAADRFGLRLTYTPSNKGLGGVGFFKLLEQESGDKIPEGFSMLSTHPSDKERLQALKKEMTRLETSEKP
jgi:beta-barrel assembly-enhancing protease